MFTREHVALVHPWYQQLSVVMLLTSVLQAE